MATATSWADTFAGRTVANGWGNGSSGKTWAQVTGTDLLAVGNGQGSITSAGSGASNTMLYGSDSVADAQCLVRLKLGILSFGDAMGLILRSDGTANNYYRARNVPTDATHIEIGKRVAGVNSAIATFAIGFAIADGSIIWMRFAAQGTTLKLKCWLDGTAEPANYNTTNDNSFASGQYGIYSAAAPGAVEKVDNFSGNILSSAAAGRQGNHRAFARVR